MKNLYTSLDRQSLKWKSNMQLPLKYFVKYYLNSILRYLISQQLSVPLSAFCISGCICRDKLVPNQLMFRISRPEVFTKRGVLKNFAKFTGKYLCRRLFFVEVAGLR